MARCPDRSLHATPIQRARERHETYLAVLVSVLLAALNDKMGSHLALSPPPHRQTVSNVSRLSAIAPALALSARSAGPHLLLVVLVNVRRETGGAQLRVAREPAVKPVDAERREGRRTLAASDDPVRQVLTDGR